MNMKFARLYMHQLLVYGRHSVHIDRIAWLRYEHPRGGGEW